MLLAGLHSYTQGGRLHCLSLCLPIRSLPGEHEGGCENGIRCLAGKCANGLVKSAQGDSPMFKGHASDQGAVGEESNVHGREGKQSVHHVRGCGTNSEQSRQNKVSQCSLSLSSLFFFFSQTYVGIWRVHRVKLLASMAES